MVRVGCPAPEAVLAWEVSLASAVILVIFLLFNRLDFKEYLMSLVLEAQMWWADLTGLFYKWLRNSFLLARPLVSRANYFPASLTRHDIPFKNSGAPYTISFTLKRVVEIYVSYVARKRCLGFVNLRTQMGQEWLASRWLMRGTW